MRSRLSVFWVRADTVANFLNDFPRIMDQLEPSKTHVSTSQDRPLLARNVTARLERDPSSWLLVLDNADDYNLFVGKTAAGNAINSYVPKEGRVLITTRDPRFRGTVAAAKDGLHVEPMDTSEASDLFTKSIPPHLASQSSSAMVDELLVLLGNLPLALAQAAANVTDQQRPVHEYIAAYRDKRNRISLMAQPVLDVETEGFRTSGQSILLTYEISFEDLERDHQLSARCLNYFGFFHWQKIPVSLIRALPVLAELDDQSFRDTIKHLLHLSLIEEISYHDGSEYSVHPIIHEGISNRLSPEDKRSYLSDSVAVILSKLRKMHEYREYLASWPYLQSHALLQVNFATENNLKSEALALLNYRCAVFLRVSGMTFDSVQLATQAVAIAQDICGPYHWLTIKAWVEKIKCLVADSHFREGYNESKFAMERLDSAKLNNEAMSDEEYLELRAKVLQVKRSACAGLGEYKEGEETANELIVLRRGLPEDTELSLEDRYSLSVFLFEQGKFQEAQEMNNELLISMDEQQRTAHKTVFLTIYALKAGILSGMRRGSEFEPAVILGHDEERDILQIHRDVFKEHLSIRLITDRFVWLSCNNLLSELSQKGETPEAADILKRIITGAVESGFRFEGQMIQVFGTTLRYGLDVIESLHGTGDARQEPPGLPIANLFVQIIELAGTAMRRHWRGSRPLYDFALLFSRLGDSHRAEELLCEALQDNRLEEDKSMEGPIHYNLMLAIALQGRPDDARRYRDTHLALITPEESKRGDLEQQLRLVREAKELYDKAKGILAGRNSKVPESWWTENRVALNRVQLRYGLLVPATAGEDRGPYGDASDTVLKKQKRKPRGLGGIIDKLHRTSPSNPHD